MTNTQLDEVAPLWRLHPEKRLLWSDLSQLDKLVIAVWCFSVCRLVHLDLIMFGIPSTLADVLQLLPSLKTLSVWPLEVRDY